MPSQNEFSYKNFNERYPLEILVVSERIEVVQGLSTMLEAMGYSPVEMFDGFEAVRLSEVINYDIIFMSLEMQNMGGLEAVIRIRDRETFKGITKGVRIVGMNSYDWDGLEDLCLCAGMNGFIKKPITFESLAQVLTAQSKNQDDHVLSVP